jgi:hypothetical protein
MEAAMASVTKDSVVGKWCDEVRAGADALCQLVTDAAKMGRALYDVERDILRSVLRLGHAAMEGLLELQGLGDLGETVSTEEGRTLHRSQEPAERRLRTVFGEHRFRQYVYSRGAKRAIELRPIDARLELSPRVGSYLLEEFSQLFCLETAFGQSSENLERVFQQTIPVDTLEAVSRQMGTDAKRYAEELPVPPAKEEGKLLVVTLDGKGVPLIQAEPAKVKAFESRRLRPGNRRMATLAGAYSVDPFIRTPDQIVAALFREDVAAEKTPRPRPQFKHLTVHFPEVYGDGDETVQSTGGTEACCWLSIEVNARRQARQPLVLLIDGDHRLWDAAADHLPTDRTEILDIVHVSAYLWEAAGLLCHGQADREAFTRTRLLNILQGGVKSVVRGLRHMVTARQLRGETRADITRIANYFEAHAERMRYNQYLAEGLPIATGVIEGACRHLVKDRMERSGMRWTLTGAKSMLNVRAVHESGYWEQFQTERRKRESATTHPHRKLLRPYTPLNLAC